MNRVSSAEVTAEVGPDVEAFPNASHLSSWGGVCPGNYESAGKRAHSHTTKGKPHFRATLNQSAWASSHKKGSEFQQGYQRLSPKLQHKGAIIAVAHALGARGRSDRTPLTDVRGSVESAGYRAATVRERFLPRAASARYL